MDAVRLHFPEPGHEPLPLLEGRHAIGWRDGHPVPVAGQAQALLTINVDRRGIWLNIVGQTACVHVNGRRVYKIALLRCGDVIHLDRAELRLCAASPNASPASPAVLSREGETGPRRVLRALSGPDHGRCFTLEHPRLIGHSARADIQIDTPARSAGEARLEQVHGQLVLRHLRADGRALVNGHSVHETMLAAGDQVVFRPRHRFVVESPQTGAPPADSPPPAPVLTPSPRRPLRALLWLLTAAALLAAALAGVLLLGPV